MSIQTHPSALIAQDHYNFFIERFNVFTEVHVSLSTPGQTFNTENISALLNITTWKPAPVTLNYKLDQFIKTGSTTTGISSVPRNSGEPSEYAISHSVYMICPNAHIEIQFIEEFKDKKLFRQFTKASGSFFFEGAKFVFSEINASWDEGLGNSGLSFYEAIKSTQKFVAERCERA